MMAFCGDGLILGEQTGRNMQLGFQPAIAATSLALLVTSLGAMYVDGRLGRLDANALGGVLTVQMVQRFLSANGGNDVIIPLATGLGAVVVVSVHRLTDFRVEMPASAVLLLAVLARGMSAIAAPKRRI
jgi:hypothetical protein